MRHRKAAGAHIWKAGTKECLALFPGKLQIIGYKNNYQNWHVYFERKTIKTFQRDISDIKYR